MSLANPSFALPRHDCDPAERGFEFDSPVPDGGYRWWYLDALSVDGEQGLTVIAFVGSVFSPYYAWARRKGVPDAENHVAINVALYDRRRQSWAMTERGRRDLRRSAMRFEVGPSAWRQTESGLEIEIDEIGMPIPRRIRGSIRISFDRMLQTDYELEAGGQHIWRPLAPLARMEADFDRPAMRFSGQAYLDTNAGAEPLEKGFKSWTWARGASGDRAMVIYDCERRDGTPSSLALSMDAQGQVSPFVAPPRTSLPGTLWKVARVTRADDGYPPKVVKTLEDTPFYNRSVIATRIDGVPLTCFHESLCLDRFSARIVQLMLPFRMPRQG